MRKITSIVYKNLLFYGFDLNTFLNAINYKKRKWIINDYKKLLVQKGNNNLFKVDYSYPIFNDKREQGGVMKGHYFHQDLYVARQIFLRNPLKHLDIGSRTDGFVAHVASFREIEIIDIREIKSKVTNISFRTADLMVLPSDLTDYCDSISSLHAIEHFGLGRYGDPIDYFGYLKALNNIYKILKKNGNFYFSVPIGCQRIEFNAHRIFSLDYLIIILTPLFKIINFSFIDDNGDFFENVILTTENIKNNFGCTLGCGIFILEKI